MANKSIQKEDEARFTKEQLLASKRFKCRLYLVSALLTDGKEYTIEEVENEIQKYLKKEVH